MQFNVVPRTGGLAINRKNRGKRGVRWHNSHKSLQHPIDLELCEEEHSPPWSLSPHLRTHDLPTVKGVLLFIPRGFLDPWHEHRDGDEPEWKHALLSYRLLNSGCFSRAGEQLLLPLDPWNTPTPLLNPPHHGIPLL